MGKIRCPLRPASMQLNRDRPEILRPPQHPQACCTRQTLTVPADVDAKTRQKHDYPSVAWRRSYARRTGAERGFATAKDPATNDIARGWCRLMGLAPLMLFTTMLLIIRNQRILAAWNTRQQDNPAAPPRAPPKTRKRRRRPLSASPPDRPDPRTSPRLPGQHQHRHDQQQRQHAREPLRTRGKPSSEHEPRTTRQQPRPAQAAHQNVRPKRENRPH